jgi:hypothetical protein
MPIFSLTLFASLLVTTLAIHPIATKLPTTTIYQTDSNPSQLLAAASDGDKVANQGSPSPGSGRRE